MCTLNFHALFLYNFAANFLNANHARKKKKKDMNGVSQGSSSEEKKKKRKRWLKKKFFCASRGKIDHAKSLFLTAKGTG